MSAMKSGMSRNTARKYLRQNEVTEQRRELTPGELIGHLLRKPGAFANYRWREELFPAPVYRAAYDHLERSAPVEADRRYLELLKLAAEEGQTAVENALEHLLGSPRPVVSAAEARAVLDTWNDMRREWRHARRWKWISPPTTRC